MTAVCECGCGLPAPLAKTTSQSHGRVVGQPLRFVHGHALRRRWKLSATKGYREIVVDTRRVKFHRLRAERALGKPLPAGAVVHHADGSMRHDAPLVICQSEAYHTLLHARMRVKAAGGNPNTDKICGRCGEVKHRESFGVCRAKSDGLNYLCLSCNAQRSARNRANSKSIVG